MPQQVTADQLCRFILQDAEEIDGKLICRESLIAELRRRGSVSGPGEEAARRRNSRIEDWSKDRILVRPRWSSWIHPYLRASYLAFMADEMEKDTREFRGLRPTRLQGALRDGAVVALVLGKAVHMRLGWNHEGTFDELLEGLGAHPALIEATQ